MHKDDKPEPLSELLRSPDLAVALDSDRFKQFLDHIPFAIAVAQIEPQERVTYVNLEFERLASQPASELLGFPWSGLKAISSAAGDDRPLSDALMAGDDHIGSFRVGPEGNGITVDAWSNVIEDETGTALFRLVALAPVNPNRVADAAASAQSFRDKDLQLRELQHRVKNNLQLITSLIRLESHNAEFGDVEATFDRLAGRVDALALLYRTLSEAELGDSVDLGIYLSQVASAVMKAHAVEGIRLDLKVDTWPVSINVAMPTGLVVNEVLTNALKHAFVGRPGGTITLHSLVDARGCEVSIADDGVGLPPGTSWPTSGRLGSLIVQSLRQNVGAKLEVTSSPETGLRVVIRFLRANAAPEDAESGAGADEAT